jgi:hypothetical protein
MPGHGQGGGGLGCGRALSRNSPGTLPGPERQGNRAGLRPGGKHWWPEPWTTGAERRADGSRNPGDGAGKGYEGVHFGTLPALSGGTPVGAPLVSQERVFFDPRRNPAFHGCESIFLVARRRGRPCGRVAGIISMEYNRKNDSSTGRFGWFEADCRRPPACCCPGGGVGCLAGA